MRLCDVAPPTYPVRPADLDRFAIRLWDKSLPSFVRDYNTLVREYYRVCGEIVRRFGCNGGDTLCAVECNDGSPVQGGHKAVCDDHVDEVVVGHTFVRADGVGSLRCHDVLEAPAVVGKWYNENKKRRERKKNNTFEAKSKSVALAIRATEDEIAGIRLVKEKRQLEISSLYLSAQEEKVKTSQEVSKAFLEVQQLRAEELRIRMARFSQVGESNDEDRRKKREEMKSRQDWRDGVEGVPDNQSSVKTSSSTQDSISADSSVSQRSYKYGGNSTNISRVSGDKIRATAQEFGALPVDLISAAVAYIDLMRVRKSLRIGEPQYERLVNLTKFRATNMHSANKSNSRPVYNFDCM